MHVLVFVAAVGSVLLSEVLGPGLATDLLNTSWILAPYLVLTAVMVFFERRTSLTATAVATLLGGVGAVSPVVIMWMVESDVVDRLVPIYQAGAIAVLVPTCKWLVSEMDARPQAKQ